MRQITIILCWLMGSWWASATTYYVATNGNDLAGGTNWATALLTISNAVHKASDSDTILVSNGTYTLSTEIDVGKVVTIQGFNGYANTMVNGNGAVRCFSITATAILTGLTISNGFCNGGNGGGIYIDGNVSATITKCLIIGNSITNAVQGGGIYIYGYNGSGGVPTPIISNCIIQGNIVCLPNTGSGGGGGIFAGRGTQIKNCAISGNKLYSCGHNGQSDGGGGVFESGWETLVANCLISNNYSIGMGGGIDSFGIITNCVIVYNVADGYGDTGYAGGGGVYSVRALLYNCTVSNNRATYLGGGEYDLYPVACAINCVFQNNSDGGYCGGLFLDFGWTGDIVRNCLFDGNSGFGLYVGDGAQVDSSTFASNSVYGINMGNSFVTNCIFSGNGTDIHLSSSNYTNNFYYCCCPSIALPPTQGNIMADPQFADFTGGNFRLSDSSPCINAGTNQQWMYNATDLDSHRRIDKLGGIVDIGCYERIFPATIFVVH